MNTDNYSAVESIEDISSVNALEDTAIVDTSEKDFLKAQSDCAETDASKISYIKNKNLSNFNNDTNFIDKDVDNLTNYTDNTVLNRDFAKKTDLSTKTSDLTNDGDGTSPFATEDYVDENGGKIDTIEFNGVEQTITNKKVSMTESDPTVPSWAKQSTKPTYSYSEITDKPNVVTTDTAQTITALKTFTQRPMLNAYQEVEYIESDGNQYILTDFKVGTHQYLYTIFEKNDTETSGYLFGFNNDTNGRKFNIRVYNSNNTSRYTVNLSGLTTPYDEAYSLDTKMSAEFGLHSSNYRPYFIIKPYSSSSGANVSYNEVISSQEMAIFGLLNIDSNSDTSVINKVSGKLYGFKIGNRRYHDESASDNIIHDLVPVYRLLDNAIGLYDKITNKFYANAGTGTFTKGSNTANVYGDQCATLSDIDGLTAEEIGALPSSTKYGASIDLTLNSTTYVLTIQLKDQDGNNLGQAKTIDLPLESIVVSAQYYATYTYEGTTYTKVIVITLATTSVPVIVPVGDLVSGLQSEITSQNKLSADLVADGETNKAFTATEKSKLAGIENGAEANVQPDWSQTNNTQDDYIKNKPTDLSAFNEDSTHRLVTDTEKTTWNGKQDAITSSNKLSADNVDDTNSTNKFVTTSEKNTWNGKQDALPTTSTSGKVLKSTSTAGEVEWADDTDYNTWRSVKVDGVEKLSNSTSGNALDLTAGNNVTLTESNGVVTISATDTTYESKTASSGGSDVSLVTTGEKYTWDNKQNALPTTSTSGKVLMSTSTSGEVEWVTPQTMVDTGATSVEDTGSGNAYTSSSYDAITRKITFTKGTIFQSATDNSLNTTSKTITGAINEVNSLAKEKTKAEGYTNYSALITALNSASATEYNVGQSFYVQTQDVPDLWIMSVESTSLTYTYTTDSAFVTATAQASGQQVGYYKLAQLETQKVDLSNYSTKSETVSNVSYDSTNKKIQQTINGTTTDVVTFGDNAFNSTTIPTTTDSVTSGSSSALTSGGAYTALNNKMNKANPEGTGSISINRKSNTTVGTNSATFNAQNTASGNWSFAEGYGNTASGTQSHAEGGETTASNNHAHAEGHRTIASGTQSHAEGYGTTASNGQSHAEGYGSTASGERSHAEGTNTYATGTSSHAEGTGTYAQRVSQHTFGEYNIKDTGGTDTTTRGTYVEVVGNGTSNATRSNARTLDWSGNEVLSGTLQATGFKDGNNANYKAVLPDTTSWTADKTLATTDQIPSIPALATVATTGNYNDLTNKPTIPSAVTSVDGLSGGALTSPLTISGGDAVTASKIALDHTRAGQITDENTGTLFGFLSNNATTLTVGGNSYVLNLRGSTTRPQYKSSNLALYSDIPTTDDLLSKVYPIGSVYLSTSQTSPASFLGGTWEALSADKALWTTTTANTGGNTLSAQLPNIKGTFAANVRDGLNGTHATNNLSGCFTKSSPASAGNQSNAVNIGSVVKYTMNASISSSTYVDGGVVRPASIRVYAWKRTA